MPAARDLTGLRFGRLTVLRSDGRVFWGHDQSAWLCRCDCGVEVRVPMRRLTTKQASHQYHACDTCRARPCDICGKPVPRETAARTCSAECLAEKDRRYQLDYYHQVRAVDPEDTAKRHERARRQWADLPPEERLAYSRARAEYRDAEVDRVNARHRHTERMADPEYRARRLAQAEQWRAANSDRVREFWRQSANRRRARKAEIELLHIQLETPYNDD